MDHVLGVPLPFGMHDHQLPQESEYAPFYKGYVTSVLDLDIITALQTAADDLNRTLSTFSEAQGDHRYAPGKWSVKELLQHVIDTERIMSYRALTFARQDPNSLPGFEENEYAACSNADRRSLTELSDEFNLVRKSTIALFRSFTDEMLVAHGNANGRSMSVRALGYVIAGHGQHHVNILEERYR
ncbi:MAG: DinB family protein [Flavobacteriales bacterium]|nr:DinB family protein [Flavobacteriales bacterium]